MLLAFHANNKKIKNKYLERKMTCGDLWLITFELVSVRTKGLFDSRKIVQEGLEG